MRIAKRPIKLNFIPVEGDVIQAISNVLEPMINSALAKHGATLKISVLEILRNHAKV